MNQKNFQGVEKNFCTNFRHFFYKNGHNSQNFCIKDLGLGSKFTSSHILQWPSSLELFQKAFWVLIFMYAQIRRKKIKAKIFFNTLNKFLVHSNLLHTWLEESLGQNRVTARTVSCRRQVWYCRKHWGWFRNQNSSCFREKSF